MNTAMLFAFGCYVFILIIIGYLAWRRQSYAKTTSTDFIVGGRSVNYWVTAISAHAADMSDWLFMGFPAAIYLQGMFNIWVAISLVLGMFVSWQFIAPAIRRATAHYRSTTLTSFFEAKYHDTTGRISLVGGTIMAFFFTIYLAAGIKGVGYVLSTSFGIPYHVGGLIAIVVTLSYTLAGGFVAAAWVDFFQGIFLLAVVIITPLLGYFSVGGYSALVGAATQKNISLQILPNLHTFIGILLGPIAWGLGYLGMPHILSKFMGARSADEMYKSKYIGITWQILALSGAALTGFVGLAFFATPLVNPEQQLFVNMTMALFPAFIAGFILCGILAATLSTMNSQLLVLAGVITDDLYKKRYNPTASEQTLVTIFRIAITVISLFAFFVSWNEQSTIFGLVQFAWSGLGASFGPLTVLALYAKSINKHGACAGILAGGTTALLWRIVHPTIAGFMVNEMLPGFVIGLVTIVGISRITKK